jgi:catechol 2,3-dioxygenase-like lactoylglutathione lyase family enzyme
MAISPQRLDHVALWVAGREPLASRLGRLGLRVIEQTDAFTLMGGEEVRRGKLTLFDAEGPRHPGVLFRIGLRLPDAAGDDIDLGEGLVVRTVPGDAVDLDHVAFRVPDPQASARLWGDYGFQPGEPGADGVERVELSGAFLELHSNGVAETDAPLLNHLGLLVASANEHRDAATERGIEVVDFVDAPNTLAVFVRGPDGVKVEYVEHKPSFALK